MMTFRELRDLVGQEQSKGLSFQECHDALNEQEYEELGPGSLAAGEAIQIFRLRRDTARRAQKDVAGLDEAINALERLSPDDKILLFHFSGREMVFSVFVSEKSGELLGCVRVRRAPFQPG